MAEKKLLNLVCFIYLKTACVLKAVAKVTEISVFIYLKKIPRSHNVFFFNKRKRHHDSVSKSPL